MCKYFYLFVSSETGTYFENVPNGLEYSDVRGSIDFSCNKENISIIKIYLNSTNVKFNSFYLLGNDEFNIRWKVQIFRC